MVQQYMLYFFQGKLQTTQSQLLSVRPLQVSWS